MSKIKFGDVSAHYVGSTAYFAFSVPAPLG